MKTGSLWPLLAFALVGCAQTPAPDETGTPALQEKDKEAVEAIERLVLPAGEELLNPSHPPAAHLIYVTVDDRRIRGLTDAVRRCPAPEAAVTKVDGRKSRLLFRIPIDQDDRAMCIRRLARPFGLVVADSR